MSICTFLSLGVRCFSIGDYCAYQHVSVKDGPKHWDHLFAFRAAATSFWVSSSADTFSPFLSISLKISSHSFFKLHSVKGSGSSFERISAYNKRLSQLGHGNSESSKQGDRVITGFRKQEPERVARDGPVDQVWARTNEDFQARKPG
jgi:hypothetical protein